MNHFPLHWNKTQILYSGLWRPASFGTPPHSFDTVLLSEPQLFYPQSDHSLLRGRCRYLHLERSFLQVLMCSRLLDNPVSAWGQASLSLTGVLTRSLSLYCLMCVCVCVCVYLHIYVYVYMCVSLYIHLFVNILFPLSPPPDSPLKCNLRKNKELIYLIYHHVYNTNNNTWHIGCMYLSPY